MLHALIMAGGAGTRFWPASRAARPKQLLKLLGDRTMIQSTADRLQELVPPERTMVITGASLVDEIRRQLPKLPPAAVIGEPCRRDTAPCIGLAAHRVVRRDPQGTMLVLPADHVIQPAASFRESVRAAARLVDAQPGRLVTFGIRPTYASESFGYIQRGEPLAGGDASVTAWRVGQFREKPSAERARLYLASGEYYWNAGIFVWKARTILDALARFQPDMSAKLEAVAAAMDGPDERPALQRQFEAIDAISIDYAVLERHEDVAMIEAPFEWDDVGSWQALARLLGRDEQGNTVTGRHLGLETRDAIVHTTADHLVVTLGVHDLIVVHTPDVTLVANRHDERSLREVIRQLAERGWTNHLESGHNPADGSPN